MKARLKFLAVVIIIGAAWLFVLLKLGLWHSTWKPSEGVLSYTFNGWADFPVSRHLFLAQYEPGYFARGAAYTSYSYPFLFFNFLFLAPFHFLLKLPYEVAQNFLPYFYVLCLALLLIVTAKEQLLELLGEKSPLLWVLAFASIGILVTCPVPWVALLIYNRDNFHVLAAGAFCYLSTSVFYDDARIPKKPFLVVGVFLALWSPLYIPAWILAFLFINRAIDVERTWILKVAGVSALGALNYVAPKFICVLARVHPSGSGFVYRSGLDGSTKYMTDIYHAVLFPNDPRHWPFGFYFLLTLIVGVIFHYLLKGRSHYRPLRQAFFLLIPYCTIAIFLPQFTSIHPYLADQLLVIIKRKFEL